MKKRSQVKIGETLGVIIIVYLVIIVGLVWYNGVNARSIERMQEADMSNRAYERYLYLSSLDLLRENRGGYVSDKFDINALLAFNSYFETELGEEFLFARLGDSFARVLVYYPEGDSYLIEEIVLYNNSPQSFRSEESYKTLIPISDRSNGKTYIGVLEIRRYG